MESKQNTSTQERKGPRKFSDQSIQVDDSTTMSRQEFANHEILHGRKAQIAGFIVKADSAISNYKLYDVFSEKDGHKCTVYRRFRDFSWLYSQLINQFYGLVIPSLPQKNVLATFDLEGVDYQAERMRQLERFLNILMRKEAICKSKILLGFMTYSNSDFTLLQNEASNSDVAECLRVSAFDEIKHTLLSMIMTQ